MKRNRRDFLKTTAAGVAASSVLSFSAKSYAQVPAANERISVVLLGVGSRAQQHVDILLKLRAQNLVNIVGVCDVWDGNTPDFNHGRGRGLYPTALRCGLQRGNPNVTKDYQRLLGLHEVNVAFIGAPGPLARQDVHRRRRGREGRLLRKADDQDHRRGPCRRRCREAAQHAS